MDGIKQLYTSGVKWFQEEKRTEIFYTKLCRYFSVSKLREKQKMAWVQFFLKTMEL